MSAELRYVDLDQRTPAWHNWRQSRRMASETPALLGLSKYGVKSPLDLWRVKVTGEQPPADDFAERARAHGEAHEPAALAAVNEALWLNLSPACLERGHYGASFDGVDWGLGDDEASAMAEIKCPYAGRSSSRWRLATRGEVRNDDMAQIQHQLMVSRAPIAYYAVYVPGEPVAIVEVKPDLELQARIAAAWDAFWPSIETLTPPDDAGPVKRDDEDWAQAAVAYRMAKSAADAAAKALKAAEDRLRELAGEASAAGYGLTLTRYWAKGSVEYGQIPALAGLDLEQFRKPGAWRTRINIAKETK